MFSYLSPDNVFKRYADAKKYTEQLTQPFSEFQRIARNEPYPNATPEYPSVTDGTTASIIQKTPKRAVQQLPTGSVVTDDEGWLGIVADFIYTHKILPYANEDYGVFEKSHLVIENGLTNGSTCTYAPFLNHDGYFCPDLTLPYWGDVFIPKGKKSAISAQYVFIRSWWQESDLDALIDREGKSQAQAEKRKEQYDSTWDLGALQQIKDKLTSKDQQGMTPSEQARGSDVTGVELVTGFQNGVGAKFYTFEYSSKTIVRTKPNKDPRGKMPINWFFADADGTNPLGRGIVELIGPLQNLIDSDMQAYQYNRALALQPPVVKYGNVGKFSFAPNEVLDASDDPNAKIVPLVVDTSALTNYPQLYGLQKSQLLNLVNSPDTSISSDVGNPNFSKTTAGVNAQTATISVDDNAIRKSFERWFEDWSETVINMYFAERTGTEMIQLDKATAQRLRELPDFDQSLLNDQNQILVDYDTDTPALKFRVDPSTTAVADKSAQVQDATNLLDLVMKYPMLNVNFGGPIDTDVLARRIVVNSGIDDPEQVAPEPTEAQKQSKEMQKNQVNPFSPMFDKPSIKMSYQDLPPAAQLQLLANAGIHVQMSDLMQGPVVDPNSNGNRAINPMDTPNILLPGGGPVVQPGQAPGQVPGQAPVQNPLQQDGVNLTPQEIARLQSDPRFAQAQAQAPPQGPPEPPLVQHLKSLGLSDSAVQQVVGHTLSHAGGQ